MALILILKTSNRMKLLEIESLFFKK